MVDGEVDVDVAWERKDIEAVGTCANRAHAATQGRLNIGAPDFVLSSSAMVGKGGGLRPSRLGLFGADGAPRAFMSRAELRR